MAKVSMGLRNRKAAKSSKKTVSKAITSAKKSNFAKAVKKVINAESETKQAFHRLTDNETLLMFNSQINSVGDMCQVIPNMDRGTQDNQRVGDQIKAQSLIIRGHMRYNPSSAINDLGRANIAVRLMVLSIKARPSYATAKDSVNPLSSLLKKGGTTSSFAGYLSDLYADINTDIFTKHYNKVYYLNQQVYNQPATAGAQGGFQDLQNIIKFFKIKVPLKNKIFKYDDGIGSGLQPSNFGPFLVLGYVYLNGASPDSTTTSVGLYYDSMLNYQDN